MMDLGPCPLPFEVLYKNADISLLSVFIFRYSTLAGQCSHPLALLRLELPFFTLIGRLIADVDP